jgi:hypothetical protein
MALSFEEYRAKLEGVGSDQASRDTIAGGGESVITTLLKGIHAEVVERLLLSADRYKVSASNNLKQSIDIVDLSEGTVTTIGITAAPYARYIDLGVNGTEVNHGAPKHPKAPKGPISFKSSVMEWVKDKGVRVPEETTAEKFAIFIMSRIKKKGKAPRPFISDVLNEQLNKEIREAIVAVYSKALIVNISKPWQ